MFTYNERLFEDCAKETVKLGLPDDCNRENNDPSTKDRSDSCSVLFWEHQQHFKRIAGPNEAEKYCFFRKNVLFVFEHNLEGQTGLHTHTLRLNRFSDQDLTVAFEETSTQRRNLKEKESASIDSGSLDEKNLSQILEDWMGIGKGSMNHLAPKRPRVRFPVDNHVPISTLRIPVMKPTKLQPFQVLDGIDSFPRGSLLEIKGGSFRPNRWNSTTADPFSTQLNWASTENPDGVTIVNKPFDQNLCGSCWASAATGSLEASAARNAAFDSYQQAQACQNRSLSSNAIAYAQMAEEKAFSMLNLSIQELLDCDTSADQGCTGGNPLLAFYYIHRYGLTSWERYPYVGVQQDQCHKDQVTHPVASVSSWGILPPNFENRIELALRYIGPVAAGINGAHPSFLAYNSGIFSVEKCNQAANHAVLIVGYGQEEVHNQTRRFWIARNSWGEDWGEKGYIRIARGSGHKGRPGMCGIARSASVALGGVLLKEQSMADFMMSDDRFDDYPLQGFCATLKMDSGSICGRIASWFDFHKALGLGLVGIGMGLLALWPLTRDCRRRQRRRRLRRIANQRAKRETEPLVEGSNGNGYGATNGTS